MTTLAASFGASACGRTDMGRSPSLVVIDRLEAASGARPGEFGGTLDSDVITNVQRTVNGQQQTVATIFNDLGRASMRVLLRDQGGPGSPAVPTGVNAVTFTRYRVEFERSDGRNTQGVDVPYAFDSSFTVTVPESGTATVAFELVRHVAKQEAPLATLVSNANIISTIAKVTFYGRDLAGNDVVATGSIGVFFGNFGDPQ
jgi:hypothetical protein